MSHKHVSNKATLQNSAFLSKLGSTLVGRHAPEVDTRSSIQWHKTSQVTERIVTSTGTVAVYEDMSEEKISEIKTIASLVGTGEFENLPPSAAADAIYDAAKAAVDATGEEEEEAEEEDAEGNFKNGTLGQRMHATPDLTTTTTTTKSAIHPNSPIESSHYYKKPSNNEVKIDGEVQVRQQDEEILDNDLNVDLKTAFNSSFDMSITQTSSKNVDKHPQVIQNVGFQDILCMEETEKSSQIEGVAFKITSIKTDSSKGYNNQSNCNLLHKMKQNEQKGKKSQIEDGKFEQKDKKSQIEDGKYEQKDKKSQIKDGKFEQKSVDSKKLPSYTIRPANTETNGEATWVDRVRTSFEQNLNENPVMQRPSSSINQNKPLLWDRKPNYERQSISTVSSNQDNSLQFSMTKNPFLTNKTLNSPPIPQSSIEKKPPSKEYQKIHNEILQLQKELKIPRKSASKCIENLIDFVLLNEKSDSLLIGFNSYKTNPFLTKFNCNIL